MKKAIEFARTALPEPVKRVLRPLAARARWHAARRAVGALPVPAANRRRYAARAKDVVFVSAVPRAREAKFAHGLRRKGWRVRLLYGQGANYDFGRYFDEAMPFRDPGDAVEQAMRLTPVAFHVFSPSGDAASVELIKARPGPMLFDPTDLLEVVYQGNAAKTAQVRHAIEFQAYALAHADGYCARDLQFNAARKALNYRRAGPAIFFPEYCWGVAAERLPRREGPLRCVQAGNFGLEKQGEGDWGYLEFARRCVQAGVRFDLYPNWGHYARGEREFRAIFSDYLDLARQSALFHLHRPVEADALVQVLGESDLGVMLLWADLMGEPLRSQNLRVMPYVTSSRVFDYLDAGLPVILNRSYRLNLALLRQYGAAVPADAAFVNRLQDRMRALPLETLRGNAVRASHGLAVERHIHRLERFYGRVAAGVGISAG